MEAKKYASMIVEKSEKKIIEFSGSVIDTICYKGRYRVLLNTWI